MFWGEVLSIYGAHSELFGNCGNDETILEYERDLKTLNSLCRYGVWQDYEWDIVWRAIEGAVIRKDIDTIALCLRHLAHKVPSKELEMRLNENHKRILTQVIPSLLPVNLLPQLDRMISKIIEEEESCGNPTALISLLEKVPLGQTKVLKELAQMARYPSTLMKLNELHWEYSLADLLENLFNGRLRGIPIDSPIPMVLECIEVAITHPPTLQYLTSHNLIHYSVLLLKLITSRAGRLYFPIMKMGHMNSIKKASLQLMEKLLNTIAIASTVQRDACPLHQAVDVCEQLAQNREWKKWNKVFGRRKRRAVELALQSTQEQLLLRINKLNGMRNRPSGCANPTCYRVDTTRDQFLICAYCRSVAYCSRKCRESHFDQHQASCNPTLPIWSPVLDVPLDLDNITLTRETSDIMSTSASSSWSDVSYSSCQARLLKHQGNEKYRVGDYKGALELYSRAGSVHPPSYPTCRFNMAKTYLALGEYWESVQLCELVLTDSSSKHHLINKTFQCLMKSIRMCSGRYIQFNLGHNIGSSISINCQGRLLAKTDIEPASVIFEENFMVWARRNHCSVCLESHLTSSCPNMSQELHHFRPLFEIAEVDTRCNIKETLLLTALALYMTSTNVFKALHCLLSLGLPHNWSSNPKHPLIHLQYLPLPTSLLELIWNLSWMNVYSVPGSDAHGLCWKTSMLVQSSHPNCYVTVETNGVVVRALRPIQNGEVLSVQCGPFYISSQHRINIMKSLPSGLTCNCDVCKSVITNPMSRSFKCHEKDCCGELKIMNLKTDRRLSKSVPSCNICGNQMSFDNWKLVLEEETAANNSIMSISRLLSFLHPSHYLVVEASQSILPTLPSVDRVMSLKNAIILANRLNCFNELPLLHWQLSESCMYTTSLLEASAHLLYGLWIGKWIHGENNTLLKKMEMALDRIIDRELWIDLQADYENISTSSLYRYVTGALPPNDELSLDFELETLLEVQTELQTGLEDILPALYYHILIAAQILSLRLDIKPSSIIRSEPKDWIWCIIDTNNYLIDSFEVPIALPKVVGVYNKLSSARKALFKSAWSAQQGLANWTPPRQSRIGRYLINNPESENEPSNSLLMFGCPWSYSDINSVVVVLKHRKDYTTLVGIYPNLQKAHRTLTEMSLVVDPPANWSPRSSCCVAITASLDL